MKNLCIFAAFIMVVISVSSVMATSILVQKPEDVVKQAPLIVEVIVKDIQFNPISNLSTGEAWITLSVLDKIVGVCPSEIIIRRGSTTSDLKFLETEWNPSYSVGEHFLICLFPTSNGYSTMGLYNGKFTSKDGVINGTQISINEFKQQIQLIRGGERNEFPNELPRQTATDVSYKFKKQSEVNSVMSAGSQLNGEFITWNFTWNTSYVPVQMHYNSSGAPSGTPDANGIASLANTAYSLWTDQYSFLTIQNASPFTTSSGRVDDNYSVIAWYDPGNTNILAETHTYPNDLVNNTFYGPNSNTGVDLWFNENIGTSSWYFNQTPPTTRDSQIDFVEILAHELGHGIGLRHVGNTNAIMYPYYQKGSIPLRSQSDGDKAGRVYQHTGSSISLSGTLPHSLVLSALTNRTINLSGNVMIPSGYSLQLIENSPTVNLGSYSIISTGGTINEGSSTINGLKATTPYYFGPFNGLYGSIQTAVNNHQLGPVHIKPGTFNEGFVISGSSDQIFIYGNIGGTPTQINGVHLYGNSGTVKISDLTTHYVAVYDCTYPIFDYFTVIPWSSDVDYCFFATNSGHNGYSGMLLRYFSLYDAYDGTGAVFYNSEGAIGYNSEFANNYLATAFSLGSNFTINGYGNTIFCVNNMDIITDSYSYVTFYGGTFSGNPTVTTQGNVNWGSSYSTCGFGKSDSKRGNSTAESVRREFGSEIAINKEDIKAKIDSLKIFVRDNIASLAPTETKKAFRRLINLYKKYDIEEMKSYLQEVIDNPKYQDLSVWAKRSMIDYYNSKKEYQKSLSIADEILSSKNEVDTIMITETLFEKGLIHVYALPDQKEAANAFKELVTKNPVSPLAMAAKNELIRMGENYQGNKQINGSKLTGNDVLVSNYPNPFNPTTTIKYSIPEANHVRLVVYDYLGREVAVLVNGFISAGVHEIRFDALNLASGIYFYTLRSGNNLQTRKMLLLR